MENNIQNVFQTFIRGIPTNIIITNNLLDTNHLLDHSFQEQPPPQLTPLCKTYKDSLKEYFLSEEELSQEINCSICQEIIKKDEKVIKLDCIEQPHYFHIGENQEECGGIFPWFQENNTCPMCRTEFPAEPEPEYPDSS